MIGPRNDPKADFSMFSGSRGWILDPWGGRVNARNEKTRREAGSSEALGGSTPWTSGNRFGGTVLPKHPPSLRHEGAYQAKFPRNPVTVGRSLWRFGVSPGIGIKSCCPGSRCGRAERGDSAHGPPQRRTPAQIHAQAGMKRQARKSLNRIRSFQIGTVWYRVGCSIGASRGAAARRKRNASSIVRSWSRNPKFDTRLPVSKAGGQLAKGKALALSFLAFALIESL